MQPAVLQWFISHIETFAPAAQREERQQFYATLLALQPSPSTTLYDDVGLFVLAQIMAAHQLATPMAAAKRPERSSAHVTWYEKERQRVAKLLQQIAESPVVATFQATLTYYDAADVTCQHGRNQKTCEALYALRLTLQLLAQQQTSRWVRKQVERLRQREPHLPQLNELCAPLGALADEVAAPVSGVAPAGQRGHCRPAMGTAYARVRGPARRRCDAGKRTLIVSARRACRRDASPGVK